MGPASTCLLSPRPLAKGGCESPRPAGNKSIGFFTRTALGSREPEGETLEPQETDENRLGCAKSHTEAVLLCGHEHAGCRNVPTHGMALASGAASRHLPRGREGCRPSMWALLLENGQLPGATGANYGRIRRVWAWPAGQRAGTKIESLYSCATNLFPSKVPAKSA